MASVISLLGFARNNNGSGKSGKTVKLYNQDTGAYLGGTYADQTTDAEGMFEFVNLDETLNYRAEVLEGGASSDKQIHVYFSGQAKRLHITTRLRVAATATVDFLGAVTIASGGLTITAGGLTVTAGGLTVSAGGAAITGNSTITGTLNVTTSLTTPALNVGSGLLVASIGQVSSTGSLVIDGNIQGQAAIQAGTGLIVVAGGITATGQTALTGSTAGSDSLTVTGPASHSAKLLSLKNNGAALQFAVGFSGEVWSNQIQAVAVPATQSHRMPIYNNAGTLMGYFPIYS